MVCLAASLNLLKLVHFMVKKYSWRFNELLSDHSIGTSDGLLTLIHRYKYIQYESVTVLSGKACERGQIAGLGSLFFGFANNLFSGNFSNHLPNLPFYPDFILKIFDVSISIMAPKSFISNQNPDKKLFESE